MFNGKEPHEVSAEQGKGYIRAWRAQNERAPVRAHFFGRDVLVKMLGEPNVVGLRFHHARGARGEETLVVTGVDVDGHSLWEGTIAEQTMPCPPFCDSAEP
jgi:hypothetical protein